MGHPRKHVMASVSTYSGCRIHRSRGAEALAHGLAEVPVFRWGGLCVKSRC